MTPAQEALLREADHAADWFRTGFPAEDDGQKVADIIERIARELRAALADAERYRWLRDPQNADDADYAASLWGEAMDTAIDAAREGWQDSERRG